MWEGERGRMGSMLPFMPVQYSSTYVRISIVTQCTFYSVFPSVGEGTQDSGSLNTEKKKGRTSKGALLGIVKRTSKSKSGWSAGSHTGLLSVVTKDVCVYVGWDLSAYSIHQLFDGVLIDFKTFVIFYIV